MEWILYCQIFKKKKKKHQLHVEVCQKYLYHYIDQPDICPVKSLCHYIEVTKLLRQKDESFDYLFLTFKRPYRRATSQSISRWLKQVMKDSGIDTAIFSSHSTRHAASSQALKQGLTVDNILKAVGWSANSMTFA